MGLRALSPESDQENAPSGPPCEKQADVVDKAKSRAFRQQRGSNAYCSQNDRDAKNNTENRHLYLHPRLRPSDHALTRASYYD